MGWKPGQAIGAGKASDALFEKYGVEAPKSSVMIPQKDIDLVEYQEKKNRCGLGFDNSTPKSDVILKNKFDPTKNTDDQDIHFQNYDRNTVKKMIDEAESGVFEEKMVIGKRIRRRPPPDRQTQNHQVNERANDFNLPLPGFHRSFKNVKAMHSHTPKPPKDFDLKHKFENQKPLFLKKSFSKTNIGDRENLLREKDDLSITEYLSQKNNQRIAQITTEDNNNSKEEKEKSTTTTAEEACSALNGYMPFDDNKEKQERYKTFLKRSADLTKDEIPWPSTFNEDDINRENREFQKAARIFKPLSGMMASRFVSSKNEGFTNTPKGLHIPKASLIEKRKIVPEKDQKITPQSVNMFGKLTRVESVFYPSKLLCKRFNIKDPHEKENDTEKVNNNYQLFTKNAKKEALNRNTMENLINTSYAKENKENIEKNIQQKNQDIEERPSMSLFKAIFEDD